MALLTHAQEFQAVREAIQALTTTGQSVVSFTVDGVSYTYNASQLPWLEKREEVLANRICTRNRRKRTTAAFDGGDGGSDY
jgi:hypothetical protein